jgi:hypothetical protein
MTTEQTCTRCGQDGHRASQCKWPACLADMSEFADEAETDLLWAAGCIALLVAWGLMCYVLLYSLAAQ